MNTTKTVLMFSGQGSHYFHMGASLWQSDPTFRRWLQRMDDVVSQSTGESVLAALYDPSKEKSATFNRTLLTHPAIFMVEFALAQTLMSSGVVPDLVLGASVGAYAAAAVGGCLAWEDALAAVVCQAVALEATCEPGGMVAILADPALMNEEPLRGHAELAALNFSSHFVVSAAQGSLGLIESWLRGKGTTFQRLPVSFAYHSRWIDPLQSATRKLHESLRPRPGTVPMACCAHAQVIRALPKDYLWSVIRHPIQFQRTIAHLEKDGPCRYIDAGPSGTLATFLKYGLPSGTVSTAHSILGPFGRELDRFAAVVEGGRRR